MNSAFETLSTLDLRLLLDSTRGHTEYAQQRRETLLNELTRRDEVRRTLNDLMSPEDDLEYLRRLPSQMYNG